jgi:hypothetical protein
MPRATPAMAPKIPRATEMALIGDEEDARRAAGLELSDLDEDESEAAIDCESTELIDID